MIFKVCLKWKVEPDSSISDQIQTFDNSLKVKPKALFFNDYSKLLLAKGVSCSHDFADSGLFANVMVKSHVIFFLFSVQNQPVRVA